MKCKLKWIIFFFEVFLRGGGFDGEGYVKMRV